jgi:hypothetical protein
LVSAALASIAVAETKAICINAIAADFINFELQLIESCCSNEFDASPAALSDPNSDWYHLKLVGTSRTPMIVHVRFMAFLRAA